ncbi:MAG: hypothetical protein HOW97_40415 [Catenulispora sp.]|nr:hypothetical protein [Catenulispora sp.]
MLVGEQSNTHAAVPPRPAGLGTSAAALAESGRPARAAGGLYGPSAVRADPGLAAGVQRRLDGWAVQVGVGPRAVAGLGRLAVLTHPDTDDPVRLEAAGRLVALGVMVQAGTLPDLAAPTPVPGPAPAPVSGVGVDGEASPSGAPQPQPAAGSVGGCESGAGAASVLADAADAALREVFDACDHPEPPRARGEVPGVVTDHPVAVSALAGLSALPASPYQLDRVRREFQVLAGGVPARGGPHPPWEYLALGHVNAYSPALAALDAVDGYEVPPAAAGSPELRRVQRLAALAAALLRDVAHPEPSGLAAAIARADGLGSAAAARRAAAVHDEAMRALQHHAAQLAGVSGVPVRRYLSGLWTWLGGHRSWHTEP